MNKIEKILYLYLFIIYLTMVILTIVGLAIGPLILGLSYSPYWFFGYILTAILLPLLILMIVVSPSLYKTLMED